MVITEADEQKPILKLALLETVELYAPPSIFEISSPVMLSDFVAAIFH